MKPESDANELLDAYRAIKDPVERFKIATEAVEAARSTFMAGARQIRQEAVQQLRDDGLSLGDISKLLGIDRTRLHQISTGVTGGKRKTEKES